MRIAVFTGSAAGPSTHQRAVAELGRGLAAARVGIVYGDIAHRGLTRLEVVDTMHERKARMAEPADAFVAMPAGAGTLEELSEVWTWGQPGLHAKPTALLDPVGFSTPLRAQLDAMTSAGYLAEAYRGSLGTVANSRELLHRLAEYPHPKPKVGASPATSGSSCVSLAQVMGPG